ncbi:MobV family relaxase [Burkholderia multivorans]|uniref:MobV family relaxase n=1 Tax=Burkholderia multivorans TaxID=87883 RepID=UPI000A7466E7|nr:MobV family relaxase [Burkholderia multivorans]
MNIRQIRLYTMVFNSLPPPMAYAILRVTKLKTVVSVRRSLAHAHRDAATPNADAARTAGNSHYGASSAAEALDAFNSRLATVGKARSNAVLAVEYLITASPEAMHSKTREQQDAYFADALNWIRAKHGVENVFYAGVHRDESTPHMCAYVVPIDGRGRLNCRAYLGGSKALSEMQTEFARQVGQAHGLERGVEKSKAKHQDVRRWYGQQATMEAKLEATSKRLSAMMGVTKRIAGALIEHAPQAAIDLGLVHGRRQPGEQVARERS